MLYRTEAEIAGKQTQGVSNPEYLFLFLLKPNFPERHFQKNPGTQRSWQGLACLHISSYIGGWEAWRQSSPQKKENIPSRLQGSAFCSGSPRSSRQACRLQRLISNKSSDGSVGGRFRFVFVSERYFLRNLFCWKIAKQLDSEALGWLFCQTQNMSKGLLRTAAATALSLPLPKQLLQSEQDLVCHLK